MGFGTKTHRKMQILFGSHSQKPKEGAMLEFGLDGPARPQRDTRSIYLTHTTYQAHDASQGI